MSIDRVTRPGIALTMFGVTTRLPIVVTSSPPISRAIRRTPETTSAAATSAS